MNWHTLLHKALQNVLICLEDQGCLFLEVLLTRVQATVYGAKCRSLDAHWPPGFAEPGLHTLLWGALTLIASRLLSPLLLLLL